MKKIIGKIIKGTIIVILSLNVIFWTGYVAYTSLFREMDIFKHITSFAIGIAGIPFGACLLFYGLASLKGKP